MWGGRLRPSVERSSIKVELLRGGFPMSPLSGWNSMDFGLRNELLVYRTGLMRSFAWRTAEGGCPHTNSVRRQPTFTVSSTRRLSDSSDPTNSNEFVATALPFSTLVMT